MADVRVEHQRAQTAGRPVDPGPGFGAVLAAVRDRTILDPVRLDGLYRAVRRAEAMMLPGDLVECGCFRGGSAALMALACDGVRRLWLFDTFDGMPAPGPNDPPEAAAEVGTCRTDVQDVRGFLESVGLGGAATIVKGLYATTLAGHGVKSIAVLHVDCDWHDSVQIVLDTFYDLVVPGGVVQIDDYGHWAGARKAADGFFRTRGIAPRLVWLDYTAVQHIKPGSA